MSQPAPHHFPDPAVETASEREVRLAWERARLAEADADVAAGRYISGEKAAAWLAQEMAEAHRALISSARDGNDGESAAFDGQASFSPSHVNVAGSAGA